MVKILFLKKILKAIKDSLGLIPNKTNVAGSFIFQNMFWHFFLTDPFTRNFFSLSRQKEREMHLIAVDLIEFLMT